MCPGEALRQEVSALTEDSGVMRTKTTEPHPAVPLDTRHSEGSSSITWESLFLTPGDKQPDGGDGKKPRKSHGQVPREPVLQGALLCGPRPEHPAALVQEKHTGEGLLALRRASVRDYGLSEI